MTTRANPARANPTIRMSSKSRIFAGVIAKKTGTLLQLPSTELNWSDSTSMSLENRSARPWSQEALNQKKGGGA
jgi:hypothetical protein